ncbi:longevity assurance proteins LAG1/LAC1 [Coprinopsis marcescibilis]|uniref:Longevity assurance proteins LAG1/LAC1 n=1 Tax=Coprinopsis marcescibilis TaxID=230819 RepID=A0A5C3L7R2_COPMA|nr:longevity assurance proteins LAG1/LAC1 [Coprinopsis marcescibilis]
MSLPSIDWLWPSLAVFTQLSYPTETPANPDSFPNSTYYKAGPLDLFLIVSFIAVMAILRDVLRLGVFEPFAKWKLMRDLKRKCLSPRKANGTAKACVDGNGVHTNGHANGHTNGNTNGSAIKQANGNGQAKAGANGKAPTTFNPTTKQLKLVERSVMRFAEQGWSVVYYTFSWSFGLYVHMNLPTKVLQPVDLWTGYPHDPVAGPIKFYYLMQSACYIHQILILNAEARRKDHAQMMAHHIITVALLIISYFLDFTRVGCIILLLMDWCDIFLPLAKMIRYISIGQFITDVVFGFFMVSWLVTRHILFMVVIWSTTFDALQYIPHIISPAYASITKPVHYTFAAMLMVLQVLQCIWFWMICKVAYRVVSGTGAADERSDEEGEQNDEKTKDR